MSKAVPLLRAPTLSAWPGVVHGFTTRWKAPGVPLDLGTQAQPSDWAHVAASVGLPGAAVARLRQVHGRGVVEASRGGALGDGDALVTTAPGILLAVRTADCVPVLLVAGRPAEPPRAVAAIHAGWRGVAAGVIPAALSHLRALVGSQPSIAAAIGPCVSVDHYEVGEEVVDAIAETGVPHSVFVKRPTGAPRPFADVGAAAQHQLERAGVVALRLPHCTVSRDDLWSHRRQGSRRGSLAALIGMSA